MVVMMAKVAMDSQVRVERRDLLMIMMAGEIYLMKTDRSLMLRSVRQLVKPLEGVIGQANGVLSRAARVRFLDLWSTTLWIGRRFYTTSADVASVLTDLGR
jgi:hypothetical protein